MKLIHMAFLTASLALLGCTEPETYPITGEECGPNDPVLELDAADCGTPGLS
ncbi:hypothetical protein [uncultured Roseobacter sp.]|uniref:hypothetical protein n=1 Tax=uncultured Roseobacter sp. TaxID=114847 RepID=UPI00260B6511|nr:hypothetical protein [uncultured Roseobacter sp.]